jgi:starch phosphorylase
VFPDSNQQDDADAESLYDTLENSIVPLYYSGRSSDGVPSDWIARMKESLRTLTPQFTMSRMLKDYMAQLYLPCLQTEPVPDEK